jgi:hypothetical protein
VVSQECRERAHAYKKASSRSKIFPATWFVEPSEQHPHPSIKPETGSDEIASEQMHNRLEPRCHCEAKGEPIEQHDAHEYWRYEKHFS